MRASKTKSTEPEPQIDVLDPKQVQSLTDRANKHHAVYEINAEKIISYELFGMPEDQEKILAYTEERIAGHEAAKKGAGEGGERKNKKEHKADDDVEMRPPDAVGGSEDRELIFHGDAVTWLFGIMFHRKSKMINIKRAYQCMMYIAKKTLLSPEVFASGDLRQLLLECVWESTIPEFKKRNIPGISNRMWRPLHCLNTLLADEDLFPFYADLAQSMENHRTLSAAIHECLYKHGSHKNVKLARSGPLTIKRRVKDKGDSKDKGDGKDAAVMMDEDEDDETEEDEVMPSCDADGHPMLHHPEGFFQLECFYKMIQKHTKNFDQCDFILLGCEMHMMFKIEKQNMTPQMTALVQTAMDDITKPLRDRIRELEAKVGGGGGAAAAAVAGGSGPGLGLQHVDKSKDDRKSAGNQGISVKRDRRRTNEADRLIDNLWVAMPRSRRAAPVRGEEDDEEDDDESDKDDGKGKKGRDNGGAPAKKRRRAGQ